MIKRDKYICQCILDGTCFDDEEINCKHAVKHNKSNICISTYCSTAEKMKIDPKRVKCVVCSHSTKAEFEFITEEDMYVL